MDTLSTHREGVYDDAGVDQRKAHQAHKRQQRPVPRPRPSPRAQWHPARAQQRQMRQKKKSPLKKIIPPLPSILGSKSQGGLSGCATPRHLLRLNRCRRARAWCGAASWHVRKTRTCDRCLRPASWPANRAQRRQRHPRARATRKRGPLTSRSRFTAWRAVCVDPACGLGTCMCRCVGMNACMCACLRSRERSRACVRV